MNPRPYTEWFNEDVYIRRPRFLLSVPSRSAYTLAELLVVVLILGVMAMASIPRLQFSAVRIKEAEGTAHKLITDLRRTRSLSIRDAASNTSGYRMNVSSTQYQIINQDSSTTLETHPFDSSITVNGGTFDFGPLGNLLTGSDSQITVSSDGRTFTIDLTAATGATTLTES